MWIVMLVAPVAAFFMVLLIVYGAYWLAVVLPEHREERAISQRLVVSGETFAQPAFVTGPEPLSAIKSLDWVLRHARRLLSPAERLVRRSGMHLTTGALLLATVFFGLAAAIVVAVFTDRWALQLGAGLVAAAMPTYVVARAGRKRVEKFENQFPGAIDLIARSLRAGHALSTALELAGKEVPDPAGAEFRLVYEKQNFGMSIEDALRDLASRVPLLDARFFVTAVFTQREVGGNLSEVLERLASVIRERFQVKRQLRVVSAHGRITGLVLGLLPIVVGIAIFILAPEQMKLLFTDPVGVRLVASAAALQLLGVLIMRRIINVEY